MEFSFSRRFRALYSAHAAWLGNHLARGFVVRVGPQLSIEFRGFRRPVDLQTALADTFESYLRRDPPAAGGEEVVSICRAALLECAHEVVRRRLIRVISARAAFDWPLSSEAPRPGHLPRLAPRGRIRGGLGGSGS